MTAGIEIAADHMVIVLVDLAGRVRAQAIRPLDSTEPQRLLPQLSEEFEALRRSVPGVAIKLLGAGVVMPGPFEIEGMSSVGPATLPGWRGLDSRTLLGNATGTSVEIENDATAAAVGERLYGAGRRSSSFCFVYFGVGLGLGVIHEGRPLRGTFGNAGEIGHLVVTPRGRPALYGYDGALERFASLYALRRKLAAAGIVAADVKELQMLHDARHPVFMAWIAEAADYLAPTVAALENLFDPETVIFGGGLPDSVIDAIILALDPLPISVASRRARALPRVMRGQTGQLTAALGAAALPLLETVTPRLHIAPGPPQSPPVAALP
jgi:predicted NBD/HSP70 family sugar kinase